MWDDISRQLLLNTHRYQTAIIIYDKYIIKRNKKNNVKKGNYIIRRLESQNTCTLVRTIHCYEKKV